MKETHRGQRSKGCVLPRDYNHLKTHYLKYQFNDAYFSYWPKIVIQWTEKKYLKMKLTKIAIERGQCNLGSGPMHLEMFQ